MPGAGLSIGEVADVVGVRTSTLRFYEDIGLIEAPERRGGKRRYDAGAIERIRLIRFCHELGFTLEEIRDLVSAPDHGAGKRRWRELVDAKIAEVTETIRHAEAMKRMLEDSRNCDCISPDSCRYIDEVLDEGALR